MEKGDESGMDKKTGEISGVHSFLRKSKIFYIPRKCYAVILGIHRYGFWAEMKWINGRIKDRIAQRQYYQCLLLSQEERQRQKEQRIS